MKTISAKSIWSLQFALFTFNLKRAVYRQVCIPHCNVGQIEFQLATIYSFVEKQWDVKDIGHMRGLFEELRNSHSVLGILLNSFETWQIHYWTESFDLARHLISRDPHVKDCNGRPMQKKHMIKIKKKKKKTAKKNITGKRHPISRDPHVKDCNGRPMQKNTWKNKEKAKI